MVSPTYLRRPAFSKEWAAFEWRLTTRDEAMRLIQRAAQE
jgi:hypothetical protein